MSKYRIVDLFSGAGGLTFGFYYNLVNNQFKKRDNVEFVFANEFAPQAVAAFKKNYGDDKKPRRRYISVCERRF